MVDDPEPPGRRGVGAVTLVVAIGVLATGMLTGQALTIGLGLVLSVLGVDRLAPPPAPRTTDEEDPDP
jgi:hypothetical protein